MLWDGSVHGWDCNERVGCGILTYVPHLVRQVFSVRRYFIGARLVFLKSFSLCLEIGHGWAAFDEWALMALGMLVGTLYSF
jgi:hypothetical protein